MAIKLGNLDISGAYLGNTEVSAIYLGNELVYGGSEPTPPTPPHDYSQDYLTFRALEDGVFDSTNSILCSKDNGATWTEMLTVIVNSGDTVMCKASGIAPTSSAGIGTFSSTGRFEVEGNIMSLVSGDNFTQATTIARIIQWMYWFNKC